MRRHTAAIVILSAWVAALGWLGLRELGESDEEALAERPIRIGPGAGFYAVMLDGIQIGFSSLTVDTSTTGFQLLEVLTLELPDGDDLTRHVARSEARLTRSFRLERAELTVSQAGAAFRLEARMLGDSTLHFTGGRPGDQLRSLHRLDLTAATLPAAVPLRLVATGALRPGAVVEPLTVDLLGESVFPESARVLGDSTFFVADSAERDQATGVWRVVHEDTVQAWRVEQSLGGHPAVVWVDAEGRPVQLQFAYGVSVRRGAFEVLVTDYQRRRRAGLLPSPPGAAGVRMLRGGRAPNSRTDSVVMVLARRDGSSWPGASEAFAGGRQRVAGDTVVIAGSGRTGAQDSVQLRNMGRARAATISGLGEVSEEAFKRYGAVGDTLIALVRWVARDMLLDSSAAAATTPTQVLLQRRGSPEGKARLLAALAEGNGIRARVVSGVLVTDPDLPAHTWVEVWQPARTGQPAGWLAVDPVFGHVPASTELLRVTEGPARPLALVPRIGALRATVLSPSPGVRH